MNDMICIEGSHEEKTDEHGMISRQFVRKYKLPKECDREKLMSNLSRDGVLTIQVNWALLINELINKIVT